MLLFVLVSLVDFYEVSKIIPPILVLDSLITNVPLYLLHLAPENLC